MPLRYYVKTALEWFEKKTSILFESLNEHSEEAIIKVWEESLRRFGTWALELSDVDALSLAAALKAHGDKVDSEVYSIILTPTKELEIPYSEDFKHLQKTFKELSCKLNNRLSFYAERMAHLISTAIKLNSSIIVRPVNDSLT